MAWHIGITAKNMPRMAEHYICRSRISRCRGGSCRSAMPWVSDSSNAWRHVWLPKRCRAAAVGLRRCRIRRSCGKLTNALEPSKPLQVRCSAQEAVSFMAQYHIEVIHCYQRDTKLRVKISQYSTVLRLTHACWPPGMSPSRSARGRAASSAVCMRHTYNPSIEGQSCGAAEASSAEGSRALLQELRHDRFILRQTISTDSVN
jgi:hypothetical protein